MCPLSLATPIPDQVVSEGQVWSLNASSYFFNPAHNILAWSVQGLSASSAITMNSATGLLSGVVGYADATHAQPIPLIVIATDTKTGSVVRSNTFNLQVTPLPGISFLGTGSGLAFTFNATEGVLFQFNAARYFSNPSNFRVTWSISGASASYLTIDSTTGIVSMTPGQAELLAAHNRPLSFIVTGTDERGNVATSVPFQVFVSPAKLSLLPYGPLPDLTCGSLCCSWNPSDYISNPSSNPLQFTLLSGLPSGSQIKLSPNGTLSGVASMADVRASPITLQLAANNGNTAGPTPMPPLSFSVTALPPVTTSAQPLPNRTVKVNSFFTLDTSPYFVIPTGSLANYSLVSSSNSLSIDFTGKVSGTIVDQDYTNSPTLTFTVTANNRNACGGGAASQTFQFPLNPNWQGPSCSGNGNPSNMAVCEQSIFPTRTYSQFCKDPTGSPLTYSITGINGTGLRFDPNSGTLSGSVSASAGDLGSATITVCAMNAHALQDCALPFQISFRKAKRPPTVDPPIPSPVTAIVGQRFVGYFNFHFYEPDFQPLIYSVAGLPIGSGMGIGPITGIFSGTPNMADFRASPLILSVFASNEQDVSPNDVCAGQGQGGRARADLIIVIEEQHAPPTCRIIPVDNAPAMMGMFWARDVSQYFQGGGDPNAQKIEYALRSLPRGSGLTIDPRSGVVSGVLTSQDLQSSPVTVVVAATNGYGQCQSSFQLIVVARQIGPPPSPLPSLRPCPISARNVFMQNVNPGANFNLDLSQYFTTTQPVRLTFQSTGLPRGTGFTQNSYSGVFSGMPSQADLAQGTMTIFTTVSCGSAGQPVSSQWQLVISQAQCSICSQNNGGCQQQCTVQNPQVCQATCGCNYGYVLNSDGRTCRSSSPCDTNNGGCTGVCTAQGFNVSCGCSSGWVLNSDRQTCQYNPCGYNNGGCEQLCAPSGQQPRCSCRTGSLSSDGRSCGSSSVITVGTIPPALVLGPCQNFMFDVSTAFRSTNGSPLTFRLTGLPPQTGFSITSAGMMMGTPSNADCSSAQPLTVTISVSDGRASVSAVMFLSTFCGLDQICGGQKGVISGGNSAGAAASIPVLWPQVCCQLSFDITPYFNNQPGLRYSVLGLPYSSGLHMSADGILSGAPSTLDCSNPNPLTVCAVDPSGRQLKAILTLKYQSCDCVSGSSLQSYSSGSLLPSYSASIIPSTNFQTTYQSSFSIGVPSFAPIVQPVQRLPSISYSTISSISSGSCNVGHIHRSAQCGTAFFYDTTDNFRVNNLRFSLQGLPDGTGFALSSTGVLSGTPNSVDARSVQPLGPTVTATDGTGVACDLNIYIYVEPSCEKLPPSNDVINRQYRSAFAAPPPDAYTGILPIQIARSNQPFFLNVSSISFSGFENATYELEGLPKNNGVSMTPGGVISGTPLESMCQFKPSNLTLRARKENQQKEVALFVYFVCDDEVVRPFDLNGGTLPATTATIGELFYYDVAPFLTGSNLTAATFEVVGLAPSSSLHMSPNGVLMGFPTLTDVNGPPLLITVRDDNGRTAQSTLRVNVLNATSTKVTNATNRDPVCIPIQRQVATEGIPFLMGISSRFADQDGNSLSYSVTGFPAGSGLGIDRVSGLISGTPTKFDADAQPQPLVLTVTATDETGASCAQMFLLTVFHSNEQLNHPPATRDIPAFRIPAKGQLILRLSSYFADPDGDILSYSIISLPKGTGLTLNAASGVLFGSPTNADSAAPLTLVVKVSDPKGGVASSVLQLAVLNSTAPGSKNQTPALYNAEEGFVLFQIQSFGSFQTSGLAPNLKPVAYTITGLPQGTGLSLNLTSGTLSGTPTLQDVIAADSQHRMLRVTIRVIEAAKKVVDLPLHIKFASKFEEADDAPFAQSIPGTQAFSGQHLSIAVWPSFSDAEGDNLTFSVLGLPENSGFLMVPSGIFVGTANPADFAVPQPMMLTVIAQNQRRGKAQEMFSVLVSNSSSALPKTCGQLGWPVSSPSGCARTVKVLGGCPHSVAFEEAENMCKLVGARLCSTQEISESSYAAESNECDVEKERVWTSSWCADGSVMTQAGSSEFHGLPKECLFKQEKAMVKCCADRGRLNADVAAVSEKTCDQLPSFVTPASSTNKAVCSTTAVSSSVQKGNEGTRKCSGKVSYSKAKDMCARLGARLCTADELAQDAGSDTCGYSDERVWTSSGCTQEGQMMTQAGGSLFLRAVPKQCSSITELYPAYCCADQRPDEYFYGLTVNATSTAINLNWNWKLYPNAQVSYQKASGSKGEHSAVSRNRKQVRMGGDVSTRLDNLDPNTRYSIRIAPLNKAKKLVQAQAVEFRASTL